MNSIDHYDFCYYYKNPNDTYKTYFCNFYSCYRCEKCHCPSKKKVNCIKNEKNSCKEYKNKTQLLWYNQPFLLFDICYDYANLFSQKVCLSNIMKMTLTKNVMKNVVNIHQHDFVTGPYIIKKPGYYRLCENIVFSPNKHSDGKPTKEWINNLEEKYRQAYVLGFFAMFVIQSDNVILDLNYHTIEQSELFFHQQTFYSHIELASTPFIMGQGPANFGEGEKVASNVIIKNGCLGKSSHHGIHAPGYSNNIILDNLSIEDFAVGAIHLNGSHNVYINNVHINNKNLNIKFNSLFSQAQFIISFLEKIDQTERLFLNNKLKTIGEITKSLKDEIELVYNSIKSDTIKYPEEGIFFNKGGLDANMYGIVLNSKGVAVNGLKPLKEKDENGNNNIVLNDVSIKNIISDGTEIKGLTSSTTTTGSYNTSGSFVGPVGDVFDYMRAKNDDEFYEGNIYSDAQIAVAKFLNTKSNIPAPIIKWASGVEYKTLNEIIEINNYYIVDGRDSMSHIMKGNIGLFCSQSYRMIANDLCINNVKNNSTSSMKNSCESDGILFTGCKDILIKKYNILNIYSKQGVASDLMYKNENINIQA